MILVVNAAGECWNGLDWAQKGKVFLTVASATRSLHEEGEDPHQVVFYDTLLKKEVAA